MPTLKIIEFSPGGLYRFNPNEGTMMFIATEPEKFEIKELSRNSCLMFLGFEERWSMGEKVWWVRYNFLSEAGLVYENHGGEDGGYSGRFKQGGIYRIIPLGKDNE